MNIARFEYLLRSTVNAVSIWSSSNFIVSCCGLHQLNTSCIWNMLSFDTLEVMKCVGGTNACVLVYSVGESSGDSLTLIDML